MTRDFNVIGENIRKSREAAGFTQRELAVAISRSESSVAKYEKGLTEIPYSIISKIAEVLHISIDVLFQQTENAVDEYKLINQRLRELRKAHGLTQEQLGNLLGVSQSAVQLFETGENPPKLLTLVKIARVFNTTVDKIIDIKQPLTVGAALQCKRMSAQFTQQQVADYLELKNKSTYASWETGKSQPYILTFLRLCSLFGVKGTAQMINDLNLDI